MSAPRSVFISYTHFDTAFARELSRSLAEKGLNTWLAEDDIAYGDRFSEQLQTNLRDSTFFVLLVSGHATQSPNTLFELGAAMGAGKTILPVFLSETSSGELPAPLRDLQPIRATNLRPSEVADRVVEAVNRAA